MRGAFAILLIASLAVPVAGQSLDAPWVRRADERIDRHRKTDLRVIVLDGSGRPAPGVEVRLEMLRHAFPFGVRLDPAQFADGAQPPAGRDELPVWRCFNAVSLDAASSWPRIQPAPGQWDFLLVDDMLLWAERRGMNVLWGGLTTADPGRVPPWMLRLDPPALQQAIEAHIANVAVRFGRRVDQFDVHTQMFDHDFVARRLGRPMVRRLHELAKASAPDARVAIRFEDCLTGERLAMMVRQLTAMREAFVPFDAIAVDQRFGATVFQSPLERALQSIGRLGVEVVVTNLEVTGGGPAAAALNLETVLRTLYAEPAVTGIWFAGVGPGTLFDATAALMNEQGLPTPSGEVVDGLIRGLWWTDHTERSDELGNLRRRVFAGVYRISAVLGDGQRVETTVLLPAAAEERVILLEPVGTTSGDG